MILDFDTFHILSADIQDTVYFRVEKCRGVIMGNGFHFSLVQHQRRFDQRFAVSGGTGPGDAGFVGQMAVDLLDGADGGRQRAAVVIIVKRVEQGAVLAHQRRFGGGGAGVDAQITVAFISIQISGFYVVLILTAVKFLILFLGSEKGLHTGHFKFQFYAGFQPCLQIAHKNLHLFLCVQGGADGRKKVGVFRSDGVLFIQTQRTDKSLL